MVLVELKSIPTTLLLDRCESTGASGHQKDIGKIRKVFRLFCITKDDFH